MFRVSKILIGGIFLAVSSAVFAGTPLVPQGGEIPITGPLLGDQVWPSISLDSSGGIIAWQDNARMKSGFGIGAAMLDAHYGASKPFTANKATTGSMLNPKAKLLANKKTIFVWQCTVAGTHGIYTRIAKAATTKTTSAYTTNLSGIDIRLNTYRKGQVADPVVTGLADGSSVVAWSSDGQDGSMWGVYARKLSPAGAPTGAAEFKVNQYTQYNQRKPAVTTLANGNFVVAWISEQERAYNSIDVYARIYTPAGVPITDELPINSGTLTCDTPDVAPLNDGGFTVVWAQKDSVPTNSWDIWGRAFSPSGSPRGADFRINTYLYGDQYGPKIAAGPAGSMVVWTSMGQDGSREGVFGRFLRAGAEPMGDEVQVNTTTVSQQFHPAVAWDGVNKFLVVWASFVNSSGVAGKSGFDLYGQAYTLGSSQ